MKKITLVRNLLHAIDNNMIFPIDAEYRNIDDVLDEYTRYDYSIENALLFLKEIRKMWHCKIETKYENIGGGFVNVYIKETNRFYHQCIRIKFRINDLWGYNSVFDSLNYGVIGSKDI